MTPFQDEWSRFAHNYVRGGNAEDLKVLRRAFFAGGSAFLRLFTESASPESEEPTDPEIDAGIVVLAEVRQELIDFADALKAGKA